MVYHIIQELRSNNSRLFKEAVLEREVNNELLKRVFGTALDRFTQFYIRKIPAYGGAPQRDLNWGIDQLKLLSDRVHTGHAGIALLSDILSSLTPEDAEIIKLIIGKDLKCGVSSSTVNKTWPGLIREIPYMRCSSFKDLMKKKSKNLIDWSAGVYSQIKADGMFANVDIDEEGEVKIYTRAGNEFDVNKFGNIVKELVANCGFGHQLHGELLVMQDGEILPRQTGNGILSSVLKGGEFENNQFPVYECWDKISLRNAVPDGVYEVPYNVRFSSIYFDFSGCEFIRIIENKILHSFKDVMDHYSEVINRGLEGTVIKLASAIWMDGDSPGQWKVKVEFQFDLKMVKRNKGSGKNEEMFGSIKCVSADGKLEVNVAGLNDKIRKHINDNWDRLEGGILTGKGNGIMKPRKEGGKYSIFLPRFVELRDFDKAEADTLEKIYEQFESVVKA